MNSKPLPFNLTPKFLLIADKAVDRLKLVGKNGTTKSDFFDVIIQPSNYELSMRATVLLRYLELIEIRDKRIFLTPRGKQFSTIAKKDEKFRFLIKNLPDEYRLLVNNIYVNNWHMGSTELQRKFIEGFNTNLQKKALINVINSFMNYCKYIGLLDYGGRGLAAGASFTEFGKHTFEFRMTEQQDSNPQPKLTNYSSTTRLQRNRPIHIKLNVDDKGYKWTVDSEESINALEMTIESVLTELKNKFGGNKQKNT